MFQVKVPYEEKWTRKFTNLAVAEEYVAELSKMDLRASIKFYIYD